MRKTHAVLTALATLFAIIPTAGAATLKEVVARHIAAHGGQKNWDAIHSMRITGSFTAFSEISPFALHRKRDDRYHLDHVHDKKTVILTRE